LNLLTTIKPIALALISMQLSLPLVLLLAAAVLALWYVLRPAAGGGVFRRWGEERRRRQVEDLLKHALTRKLEGRSASIESAAGHLGLPQRKVLAQIMRMEARGLIRSLGNRLELTAEGEAWARQVMRAHRLWETYLAHEAGVPMSELHRLAERAEHQLSSDQVEALDAHLGHPLTDPHGDPIPSASGEIPRVKAKPLAAWPPGEPARIVHVEDEPVELFAAVSAAGLAPGMTVEVVGSAPDAIEILVEGRRHRLPPLAAGAIHVAAVEEEVPAEEGLVRLADLEQGEEAVVVSIDPALRGFSRRRLLDLGLTPQAHVQAYMTTFFGDPRAYRVRGTTVALRNDQARAIWTRRVTNGAAVRSRS
jgi:DtxR family transcriptional regulator, Mn-dependent transcriptional regulator